MRQIGEGWNVIAEKDWYDSNHKVEGRAILELSGDHLGFANRLQDAVGQPGASSHIVVHQQMFAEHTAYGKMVLFELVDAPGVDQFGAKQPGNGFDKLGLPVVAVA